MPNENLNINSKIENQINENQSLDNNFWEYFSNDIRKSLFKYCLALTKNKTLAEDLIGDTTLAAYDSFNSIENHKAFLSFLFTIATRKYKRWRYRLKIFDKNEFQFDDIFANEKGQDHFLDSKLLFEALVQLPTNQKQAIILSDIEGFSRKEIAIMQNTSENNIKSRLSRGRKKLRIIMEVNDEK